MNIFGPGPAVSQAEKELGPLLLDDGCQVLSTFELNKILKFFTTVPCSTTFWTGRVPFSIVHSHSLGLDKLLFCLIGLLNKPSKGVQLSPTRQGLNRD